MDDPLRFIGHDERASPISFPEGPARRVRCARLDYPFHFHGHDKRALPGGRDKHAPADYPL